jgi:alkylation response protein AidB-like acyl-CoA dehydrogenase
MHRADLLGRIRGLRRSMIARAQGLDMAAQFPAEDIADLHAAGALLAPFPTAAGGLGLGSEACGATSLSDILQALGYAHAAVGRLYEAHVNAVRLLARYGTPAQMQRAARDAGGGCLIGLWVTDPPAGGLSARGSFVLSGGKAFCSGAGHLSRALVTCAHPDGTTRLAYVSTETAEATKLPAGLQGLRAAVTGQISFAGARITGDDWVGGPGVYLREPDFSAGAWRTSAVTAGCLARLVDIAIGLLQARGRAGNPHQQARIGQAWIARETARLWTEVAARAAEGADADETRQIVATVNFARIAIEAASLQALTLVERSLGLQAFLVGTEVERVRRDLATYLRQPAPDEVLTEAAAFIMRERARAA